MSTFHKRFPLLMLAVVMLAAPAPSWSQATNATNTEVRPLTGKEPPFCETCGVVIAINRVENEVVPTRPTAGKDKLRESYEVVIRLDAGTQQVVVFGLMPQLKIGQKVRIVNGVVLSEQA